MPVAKSGKSQTSHAGATLTMIVVLAIPPVTLKWDMFSRLIELWAYFEMITAWLPGRRIWRL